MWRENFTSLFYFSICKMEIVLIQASPILRVITQLLHTSLIHIFSITTSKAPLHTLKDNYIWVHKKKDLCLLSTDWTSHLAQWGLDLDHFLWNTLVRINLVIDHSYISIFIDFLIVHDCFLQRSSRCEMAKASPKFPYLDDKLHHTLR